MKPKVISMASGLLWGLFAAYLLRVRDFWGPVSDIRFVALFFAPLVGLFTYYTSRWVYRKKNLMKALWSIVSVYLASGLYGIILATLALMKKENPSGEHFYEVVIAIWWGITLVPFLWLVYPASFLNHLIVAKFEAKSEPGESGNGIRRATSYLSTEKMKIKGILLVVAGLVVLGMLYFLIPWSISFGGFFGWIVLLASIPPILAVSFFLLFGGITSCRRQTN